MNWINIVTIAASVCAILVSIYVFFLDSRNRRREERQCARIAYRRLKLK